MRLSALVSLLLLQAAPPDPPGASYDPAVHEATLRFSCEEFLLVPVRVHLLRSKAADALECRLKEADVRRVFGKANRIWNRAGIALHLESIVPEDAVLSEDFDEGLLQSFKSTRPPPGLAPGLIHVYYVHQLPTNGVFMGPDAIFVKDTAALRTVKGGVDEPLPRVTSHEIGHALGLSHRQDTINLMASGTTGWSVNDAEIGTVRGWASRQAWILSPEAAWSRGWYLTLSALPGESPIKSRALERIRKASADSR